MFGGTEAETIISIELLPIRIQEEETVWLELQEELEGLEKQLLLI